MENFEYNVSLHDADTFKRLAYFCTVQGQCSPEPILGDDPKILEDLLNARGSQGWELVQLFFGDKGLMAFWKRRLAGLI